MIQQTVGWLAVASVAMLVGCAAWPSAARRRVPAASFYVATDGDDAWSGTLPAPNRASTDGPFATLGRARDAVRAFRAGGEPSLPIVVLVRKGTYMLDEPLVLGPEDSGTEACPVTYAACPGEKVVLSGGRRIPGPWTTDDGAVFRTHVPAVAAGKWWFRQLRVGQERQERARHPNRDAGSPWLGGFSHVAAPGGGFRRGLGCLQEKGTWLEYDITVPATATYHLRVYYANNGNTNQRFFKFTDVSGRTTVSIDAGEAVPVADLTDTGSFYKGFRWARSATLRLTKGKHVFRWTNAQGGALSLDAFMLTTDPDYEPPFTCARPVPGEGRHVVLFQAEDFGRKHGDLVRVQQFTDRFDPKLRTALLFEPGALKAWPRSPDAEVFVIPEYDWVSQLVRLVSVDEAAGVSRVAGANATKPLMPGNRFHAVNVVEAIDTPGEWALVRKTGTLHYRPKRRNFAKREIVAPWLDRVIELRGTADKPVHHVRIKGFTITDTRYTAPERIADTYHADDAAVWLWATQHCRIEANTFRDVGGYAVMLRDASTHNAIVGNTIAGSGQGGIYLNGFADVPRKRAPDGHRPAHNLVAGNHIHHCGLFYVHVAGVYLGCADHNTIAHNLIHDMTRYAISLKFACPGNVVEFNEVRRADLATRDSGSIETAGNKDGSIIRYNLVLDSVGCGFDNKARAPIAPQDSCGIYLDNMASHYHVVGNIVARNAGGLWLNWGSNNLVANNIFVASRQRQALLNCWGRKDWKTHGNRFERNILYHTDPAVPLYQASRWEPGWEAARCDRNLIFAGGASPVIRGVPGDRAKSWAAWRKSGQDAHSVVADPLFVNPAKDDYRLKPESPAFPLGFEPIPVERIGLRGYRPPQ